MQGITKSFFGNCVNDNIDLTLYAGKIHALLGENGAGKTTLMNMLTGVYYPDEGKIYHKGEKIVFDLPGKALKVGIGKIGRAHV